MMNCKVVKRLVASAAAAAALSAYSADRTISANYTLSADETVDGVLTIADGVTVDLNGHNLSVKGLAGDGTITAGAQDLTSPDPNGERVWTPTVIQAGAVINLFNNSYSYANNNDTRVLVHKSKLPLAVTYDFWADSPKKIDMYKVYWGPNNYNARGPKTWTFEGSNDNLTWTLLDSQDGETWPKNQLTRTYAFANSTAYRYYRISFTDSSDTSTANNGPYLELVQLEYFDSSAVPEIPPELRINVPAGESATNSTVSIFGNVRLVKEGAGEFVAAKAGQMYSGGNHIAAGTLRPIALADQIFGENGSDISVDAGAVFDINGSTRCSPYHYTLNGGTLVNTGAALASNHLQLGDTTLTADSFLESPKAVGFYKVSAQPLSIDLGGHVLDVTVGDSTRFINAGISNGTLRIVRGTGGNTVYFNNGETRAGNSTFDIDAHTGAYHDVTVSNLLLRAGFTAHSSATASGVYKVHGTFRTETQNFPFVKMMDGSTFDMKSWNGVFNVASANTNPSMLKVLFDEGATVTIDIAGRAPAVGDCLIEWTEKPVDVTFQFDSATAAGGVQPVATELGLFYGWLDNVAEKAWWTGGANDGDISNPQNWICKNAAGNTLENSLPGDMTRVYLEGALNVQIPVESGFVCGDCIMTNSALAADCDLRGLGTRLRVAENATINLCGRRLYVPARALTGTCTVKDAEVDHALDLTTTDASRVSSSFFNGGNTPASNLFNNNYVHGDNTKRVLVPKADWPLVVTYDFGEGKVVDAYRMWAGPQSEIKRMPKRWKFEGSDDGESWTLLDKRCSEFLWPSTNAHRTYSFSNTTAYRRYRITLEENCGGADIYGTYLELVQLEYFNLKPTQGELHIEAVAGDSLELAGLTLAGNMRLFFGSPAGAGSIRLSKKGQTYVGGTEVTTGMILVGTGTASLNNSDLLGEKGGEVLVRGDNSGNYTGTSGTIDFGQRIGYTGYKYVLDGGTICNSGDDVVTDLRLDSDSYMKTTPDVGSGIPFGICSSNRVAYADLNGHELSVRVAGGRFFALQNATLENGSLFIREGGWFATTNNVIATNNVTLTVHSASSIEGNFSVSGYRSTLAIPDYNQGNASINVYESFNPGESGLYHGATLHDGVTIDLSGMAKPLEVVSPFNASAEGEKTLRFEPGAKIGVTLGGRKVPEDVPVISWDETTKPDATVKFVPRDGKRNIMFVVMEDGLYVESSGLVILMR